MLNRDLIHNDIIGESITNQNVLENHFFFPSAIHTIIKSEFLEIVNIVSDESLSLVKEHQTLDENFPVFMSGNYYNDPRLGNFTQYIGSTAWNILSNQGYSMNNLVVSFTEMWTQEHYKHSFMEQHSHGFGSQIVGFYFLETPQDCSRIIFHDPRPSKIQINLPELDGSTVSFGSNMINFEPKPGMLVFSNSWLPHSFGRHMANDPIKFVHFNLTVIPSPQNMQCETENSIDVKPAQII